MVSLCCAEMKGRLHRYQCKIRILLKLFVSISLERSHWYAEQVPEMSWIHVSLLKPVSTTVDVQKGKRCDGGFWAVERVRKDAS